MSIRISVDPTNPGQFFACCGLLELADRLWGHAQGYFEGREFCLTIGNLGAALEAITSATLIQLDPENNTSSAIQIEQPFRPLRLDWWQDDRSGGKGLKVWAGTMESVRIAKAMQNAMRSDQFATGDLFNIGVVVFDPDKPAKKVEPYYFDARRGPNAHSRDVGFSPNDLKMTTIAFPAVEFLCLVGLQRCLPARTHRHRVYDYFTWASPLPPELLPPVVAGELKLPGCEGFQFENWYRTGQKKHKAFRSAIPISQGV